MSARWWAFGIWAAVAASLVYWGLRFFAPAQPLPPHATVAVVGTAPRGDLTRLLGVDPPPQQVVEAPASSRFQLVGVVASRGAGQGQGLALIAVDGKLARTYRVGATVDGDTVLQAVGQRSAALGPRGGAAAVALDIPPPAPPTTGVPMALQPAQGMQPMQIPQPMQVPQGAGRPGGFFPPNRGLQPRQMVPQQQPAQPGADQPPRATEQPQSQ